MSNIKERILGAVTVMTESDAAALWKLIIDTFSTWENIPEDVPDEYDLEMFKEIDANRDCQEFVPNDEALRQLGLV